MIWSILINMIWYYRWSHCKLEVIWILGQTPRLITTWCQLELLSVHTAVHPVVSGNCWGSLTATGIRFCLCVNGIVMGVNVNSQSVKDLVESILKRDYGGKKIHSFLPKSHIVERKSTAFFQRVTSWKENSQLSSKESHCGKKIHSFLPKSHIVERKSTAFFQRVTSWKENPQRSSKESMSPMLFQ